MSHTTEVLDIVFNDIEALTMAVKELNAAGVRCTLEKGGKPRAYFENQEGMGEADYVLRLQDSPYDVGFYQNAKLKGMVARTDLFQNRVAKVLGVQARDKESTTQAAMGKLYQAYAVNATIRQATKQGYKVRRVTKQDGTVQLVMNV